jgi:hypothetical protein
MVWRTVFDPIHLPLSASVHFVSFAVLIYVPAEQVIVQSVFKSWSVDVVVFGVA